MFYLKGLVLARVHVSETAGRLGCSIPEDGAVWHPCHLFLQVSNSQTPPKKKNPTHLHNFVKKENGCISLQ